MVHSGGEVPYGFNHLHARSCMALSIKFITILMITLGRLEATDRVVMLHIYLPAIALQPIKGVSASRQHLAAGP